MECLMFDLSENGEKYAFFVTKNFRSIPKIKAL